MAKRKTKKSKDSSSNSTLSFEQTLWAAADKLRSHMDAAEYKHVVLGLIFLKYISDSFEELHDKLAQEEFADPEDRDEYLAETLETFGKLFSISRQALVNDDLSALVNVPRGMASAAARVIDDKVINVLINNAALNQDSTALFHADHNNLVAPGSGAAPSVTTLEAGFVAMAQQTGPQGAILDIVPSLLIVPVSLDATARTIVSAMNDPAGATFMEPNPFQGRLEVVSTARLDADDPLQWYLSANPNIFDTIEVAFLDNQTSPYLETKDGWNVDGVEYKVRLDCVAAALDFRGLYQNDGN